MNEQMIEVHPEAKKEKMTTKQITHVVLTSASAWLMCKVPDDELLIHAPGSRPAIAVDKKVTICNKTILLTYMKYYLDEMPTHSIELLCPTNEPTT